MDNELYSFLKNYAEEQHIRMFFEYERVDPDQPSFSYGKRRFVSINEHWQFPQEIPFQLAHEISHILNGDKGMNLFATYAVSSAEEAAANDRAFKLIFKFCDLHDLYYSSVTQFMDYFGIPCYLEEAAERAFREYYGCLYQDSWCEI